MAQWKQDPQNRENIEEVTKELELPIFKPNALGKFRPWLKEAWNKIEDYLLNLKEIANSKEPAIIKKTGFNLDKTDSVSSSETNVLATSLAVKTAYDKGVEALNKANTKLDSSYCPYKIGDIYTTTSASNPAVIWVGTTWQKIEGRFLRATTSGENAGINGGSDSKTLTIANLPSHTHNGSTNEAGEHTHTQSAHSHTQPAHKHAMSTDYSGRSRMSGFASNSGDRFGWTDKYTQSAGGENTGTATPAIQSSGRHSHSITIGNTGSGTAFDIKPAYFTVHIWKRVS